MSTRLKTTEAERPVAERLREDIFKERYRPGEWLKQADLESHYNANRFEVRMALSDLSARHIIDHIPNRGYRVTNPSHKEREELYEVRTILETAAARLAVQKVTDKDIEDLTQLVDEFESAIEHKSTAELSELNMKFHNRFYQITCNELLCRQIRELRERGLPGRKGGWTTLSGIRASNEDHAQMVKMLAKKDGEGLSYAIYRHLNRWQEFSTPSTE